MDEFSARSLLSTMMDNKCEWVIRNPDGYETQTITSGVCEGLLVGGNLSLIDGLLGTPYELDTKDRILFLEDIGEKTYRLDHMLTHLRLAGKFDDCAGVVFGQFTDCPIEFPDFGLTIDQIIRDIVVPCGKPIFSDLQAGHCMPTLTLPLGIRCRMNADEGTLTILESPVC